jgi:ferric-dicitrate binding protein FerR (iron transport regulator)
MTSTIPPISPLADEAALRRAFDAEYPSLMEAARHHLGDAPQMAPRVVESAFAHAWLHRGAMHSQEQLHAYLADEVQHGAMRALSRRAAAHRFGEVAHHDKHAAAHPAAHPTHSGEPVVTTTPEESWGRIVHTIHVEGHSAEAHKASADMVRHEAAEHVAAIAKGGNWKVPAAVGAAAVVLSLGAFWWLDRKGREEALARAVSQQDARVASTGNGQLANVTLDDGTQVRLAADSRVRIPKDCSDELRGLRLEGASSFDVASGKEGTFQVFARNVVITAKGTSFLVRAYTDEPVTVQVREGTVSVRSGEEERDLSAGQGLIIEENGALRSPSAVELEEAAAWTEGKLAIVGRPLRTALPQLKRWYSVDIKVPDYKLLDRPVTVRTTTEATKEAIAQVERSGKLQFAWVGENMTFKDATAPATAQAGAPEAKAPTKPARWRP